MFCLLAHNKTTCYTEMLIILYRKKHLVDKWMKEQSLANRYNLYIMLKPVCIEKYTGIYSGNVYMRTNTHYASFYITANGKKYINA
uniref:Uncharacterized protein n=1 Tax=Anguilla anguilla TaxID=7936 RepID=A0A0E9W4F8_ANGAN